jgi:hypothetical protein
MRFTFRFLLSNGNTELLAFTANDYGVARKNAVDYGMLAFKQGELLDILPA